MRSCRTSLGLVLLILAAGHAAAQTLPAPATALPASPGATTTTPLPPLPAATPAATTTTASGLEVGTLSDVTPDYGGPLQEGAGGFPVDMWKGTDRALVERLLPKLSRAAASPAMRDLTRRLLLTNAEAPDGKSGGVNLFGARADRLMAMGLAGDAATLLALAPVSGTDALAARQRIDSLLLAGDDDGSVAGASLSIAARRSPPGSLATRPANGRASLAPLSAARNRAGWGSTKASSARTARSAKGRRKVFSIWARAWSTRCM